MDNKTLEPIFVRAHQARKSVELAFVNDFEPALYAGIIKNASRDNGLKVPAALLNFVQAAKPQQFLSEGSDSAFAPLQVHEPEHKDWALTALACKFGVISHFQAMERSALDHVTATRRVARLSDDIRFSIGYSALGCSLKHALGEPEVA
jgi:hypothetical protein